MSAISYNSVDGDTIIDVSNSENIYYANSGVNRLSDFGLIFADDNGANAVDFTGIT